MAKLTGDRGVPVVFGLRIKEVESGVTGFSPTVFLPFNPLLPVVLVPLVWRASLVRKLLVNINGVGSI